jgi:hypothetical protein
MPTRAVSPARVTKATELVDRVEQIADGVFKVPGNRKPFYIVVLQPGFVYCGCEDHEKTQASCKHMIACGMRMTRERFKANPLSGLPSEEFPHGRP